ncbi:uncharacterized protein MONBRDRAFT_28785 [Monosiga brevicollis MX1]|uniref:C3H1-type domain-containing protein n=1 Tax=Monosiga brevicollis TaxID=81824 RepID=A9V967_MONBE|nr:uncharacterized protein MONBRDRAFT_28785 [Monosiga brevicollis MX1]EDQ86005.1 predicted protein [Monosiga brevicollis MX1]|eukprot:XP_001749199.1 hypothetical protein [Monosiga brevicollis MX1]
MLSDMGGQPNTDGGDHEANAGGQGGTATARSAQAYEGMRALRQGSCASCETPVQPGDLLWPCTAPGPNGRRIWKHLACAQREVDGPLVKPQCKHWLRTGTCRYGTDCFFLHPEPEGQHRRAQLLAEAQDRARRARPDRHGELRVAVQNRGPGRRNKVRNAFRAAAFRRFLVDTFGLESLRSGTGVLDVASGKGDLAYELSALNGVPVTCIEPRQLRLQQVVLRLRHNYYHQNPLFASYNRFPTPAECEAQRAPLRHLRILLRLCADRCDQIEALSSPEAWDTARTAAQTLVWDRRGLHGPSDTAEATSSACTPDARPLSPALAAQAAERDPFPPSVADADVDKTVAATDVSQEATAMPATEAPLPCATEVWDRAVASQLVHECALIVGMHPDQAAGDLIDLALALNKPFALTPCCTYAKEFPKRRLANGTPVRSYSQLLDFLQQKHPSIQRCQLDFEGKNVCLYRLCP